MRQFLVFGAGAIGRGFLPWVFPEDCFTYIDKAIDFDELVAYRTFMVSGDGYEQMENISLPLNTDDYFDAVFVCVGQRNCLSLAPRINQVRYHALVICENDSRLVNQMKPLVENKNIYFAIPDVITSNTAPPELLAQDQLAIITERGELYLPKELWWLGGKAKYISWDDMHKEWIAKLYLHNTPHCICAYLGYEKRCTYIHEAMEYQDIADTVRGVIDECIDMTVNRYNLDRSFAMWYGEKEIRRFSNKLLYDPISRVAREPLRKLAEGERLIGAARLCIQSNLVPENIIKGIKAAMAYNNPQDPDYGKPIDLHLGDKEPLKYFFG
jgi:hypothetical protein